MELKPDFVFRPLPPVAKSIAPHFLAEDLDPLGPLSNLLGKWEGRGFNTIWQPRPQSSGNDRFLELNITDELIEYQRIDGTIPNRGFLQGDITMVGLHYLQQISDANAVPTTGLHFETGIWAVVPPTSDPAVPATVVRMATIPHGTVLLAQGTASSNAGLSSVPNIDIVPFFVGDPASKNTLSFNELDLSRATESRTPTTQMSGITQEMVNDPNSFLRLALDGQEILSTTVLQVTTTDSPVPGGGTVSTAFLKGFPEDSRDSKANANAGQVTATFWIQTVKGSPDFFQLQYSQSVLLNFNGLSWPHVTVATLRKQPST